MISLRDLGQHGSGRDAADLIREQPTRVFIDKPLLLRRQWYIMQMNFDRRDLPGVVLPAVRPRVAHEDAPVRHRPVEWHQCMRLEFPAVIRLASIDKEASQEAVDSGELIEEYRVIGEL